ncbi:MAG TPA: thiamine diphosphokinase, partial [Bacillota bacterium]|nr:thiamine diphosphokinase [Bacillota bacterium]
MKCVPADVCFIITGGECDVAQLKYEDVFVIACDKGYEYCKQAGIIPSVIIGDFDSYDGALPAYVETVRLPHEKNDSDTQYALEYAYGRGYRTFHVYGALGGRFD